MPYIKGKKKLTNPKGYKYLRFPIVQPLIGR